MTTEDQVCSIDIELRDILRISFTEDRSTQQIKYKIKKWGEVHIWPKFFRFQVGWSCPKTTKVAHQSSHSVLGSRLGI